MFQKFKDREHPSDFLCFCGVKRENTKKLSDHQRSSKSEETCRKRICADCSKPFRSVNAFVAHICGNDATRSKGEQEVDESEQEEEDTSKDIQSNMNRLEDLTVQSANNQRDESKQESKGTSNDIQSNMNQFEEETVQSATNQRDESEQKVDDSEQESEDTSNNNIQSSMNRFDEETMQDLVNQRVEYFLESDSMLSENAENVSLQNININGEHIPVLCYTIDPDVIIPPIPPKILLQSVVLLLFDSFNCLCACLLFTFLLFVALFTGRQ